MHARVILATIAVLLYGTAAMGQAGTPSRRVIAGASLPSRCTSAGTAKDWFFKTGSSTGLYICTAANSWAGPILVTSSDVIGPSSSTDNAVARFDGTTGKLLQNSVLIVDDTGITSGISTLQTSGNVGIGAAPSATNGRRLLIVQNGNQSTRVDITNTDTGAAAYASLRWNSDTGSATVAVAGSGVTDLALGKPLANSSWLTGSGTQDMFITIPGSGEIYMGTNDTLGMTMDLTSSVVIASAFGGNAPDGTGRLQAQMGTSTGNVKTGGSEWFSITEVGNVGTGEDALIPAYTIIANALAFDGDSISFRASGSTANNANVKRLRVRFIEGANNNVLYDGGAAAVITNSDWVLECDIIRESSTLFKSGCSISTTSVSGLVYADYQTGTYTFANAGTIAVTGEATSNNDIVMEFWKGWWSAAP